MFKFVHLGELDEQARREWETLSPEVREALESAVLAYMGLGPVFFLHHILNRHSRWQGSDIPPGVKEHFVRQLEIQKAKRGLPGAFWLEKLVGANDLATFNEVLVRLQDYLRDNGVPIK